MEHSSFLSGFGSVIGLGLRGAEEQWCGFSRQLSDDERRRAESGGFESGQREGRTFLALYPEPVKQDK